MSSALTLRAALTRGAIVALANWPVVLIEFVAESVYKFALGVPVAGGALMVAVLLEADITALFKEGWFSAAAQILTLLESAPAALSAFLVALSLVGVGGAMLMFVVKAGTLAVLIRGEGGVGDLHRRAAGITFVREARAYSLASVLEASRHFQRRAALLALWLGLSYIVLGGLYLLAMGYGLVWAVQSDWAAAWPLLVLLATSGVLVSVAAVNLFFDLTRVVMVADDCSVRDALGRVRAFMLADARQVLGIFGAMGMLFLAATAASLAATAGLTLISWVPLVGLLFVPLQVAFWIVRGLLFQYMSLTTLAAYQSQYRRFA